MNLEICLILGTIAALVLTILVYVLIMPASKNGSLNKFTQFLHNFFNFKKLYLETVIKFVYVLSSIFCVTFGFFLLFGRIGTRYYIESTFLPGLFTIILGPILLRFFYETLMLSIILVKNVIELNNKINSKSDNAFANGNDFSEKFSKTASTFAHNVQQQFNNNMNNNGNANNMQQPEQDIPPVDVPKNPKATKICPACGKIIAADINFCNYCGAKVNQ